MTIAFSPHSDKLIPRIFCKRFRHCCVIVDNILYQPLSGGIRTMQITPAVIKILRNRGWKFIKVTGKRLQVRGNKKITPVTSYLLPLTYFSCVDFCKQMAHIHALFIQTPYQLYKFLRKKCAQRAQQKTLINSRYFTYGKEINYNEANAQCCGSAVYADT